MDDISLFVANWNDKATNIKYISEKLNIGLDSIVFIDDNEFEQDYVKNRIPEVTVINGKNPFQSIESIHSGKLFLKSHLYLKKIYQERNQYKHLSIKINKLMILARTYKVI